MTIRRRLITTALAGSLLTGQRLSQAQATERVWRVGVLRPTAAPIAATELVAEGIPTALRELGYVEGRNLVIESRWAQGQAERLPALASELVQAKVDVIIAVGAAAVRAAKGATATIPIILFGNFDPVALRLVASLARPGGNVTGVLMAPDGTLAGKKLELIKAAVPAARKIAFLTPPDDQAMRLQVQETRSAAAALGTELLVTEVQGSDYGRAFTAIVTQRPGALFVGAHTSFTRDRQQIIALAAKHHLPAMYEWREQVEDGGLMAYGASLYGLYQRIAIYADRIFKGAKPTEMAVERPTKFELVINLKTAKALGLTIPQSVLLRADEVIR